ncbi:MAG: ABC-type branched-chain amino acid transport system periplasmic component-like protein [Pseudonocardiales bacterium]|nr:ABC-type branched-chain amino acid transport system periplasmic component-like protein [Pseudonocardiales bacterium]
MTVNRNRLRVGMALLAAATLALAGCSSSGSKSSATGSNTGGATTGGGGSANKSPIKVLQIAVLANAAFSNPQSTVAAKAYVKQVNDAGGINGHPITLEICDSDLNPNKETACFQQAVTDKVAAVVGSFTIFAATGMKLLERAGIPFIGGNGTDISEFTSKISFPGDAGEVGWYFGEAALMRSAGVKNPSLMYCDTAACGLSKDLASTYWSKSGSGSVKTVSAPLAQPQYTAQAATAVSGGADGVMLASSTDVIPKMVSAVRQANFKGPIALIDPFVTDQTIQAMGAQGEGLLVSGLLAPTSDSSNPGVQAFVKAMDAQDPKASKDGISEHAWNGFDLFGQVAKTVQGDVTASSLMAALNGVTSPITLGLTGAWTSPGQGTPPSSTYPRLTADTLSYLPEKITNNKLVVTGARVKLTF